MHYRLILAMVCALIAMNVSVTPAAMAAPTADPTRTSAYYPETGHYIKDEIKRFYDRNGGLEVFGFPLTEVFVEDGFPVQYFERARFELHAELPPENYVTLTRLGAYFTQSRAAEAPFQWLAATPAPDRTFFAESGHSLGGAFKFFWESRGGLPVFGYPISEEFAEVNPIDGVSYTVQYFERARFEYHPEKAGTPYDVQLGLLGRQLINERPTAQAQTARVPEMPDTGEMVLLGQAITGFATSAQAREFNIAYATRKFDGMVVMPGEEFSFLKRGNFGGDDNFVEGYGIVNGRLEKVVGGGICQVSTTMFRAVANAGLQVTRRSGHSYVVNFYENILGFDAAVFDPSLDFRWRNDTAHPITIKAWSDPKAAKVTFQLWGISDGRKVSYEGPVVKNRTSPGAPIYQYDATLKPNQTLQLVHGRDGMDVNYYRTVTMPDGSIKHNDNFYTHYEPWADFFTHGKNVKPPKGARVVEPKK